MNLVKQYFQQSKHPKLRSEVLHQEYLSGNLAEIEMSAVKKDDDEMARDYLEHMLKTGSPEDRQEAIGLIKSRFVLNEKKISLLRGRA